MDRQGRCSRMVSRLVALAMALGVGSGLPQEAWAQAGAAPTTFEHTGAGTPDAAAVHRVAEAIGTGRTVDLRTTDGRKLRAKIQSVAADSLSLERDGSAAPVVIRYEEVTRLRRVGLHTAAKAGIVAGLAIGVPYLIWGLMCASSGCGQ